MCLDEHIIELFAKVRQIDDAQQTTTTQAAVDGFVQRTRLSIPPQMQAWLKHCNGSRCAPGGYFGIQTGDDFTDLERVYEYYPVWKEERWLPVASDGCGNYYLMSTASGSQPKNPIFFIDVHENPEVPTYLVASSLFHFLRFIMQNELDNQGKHIDMTWPLPRSQPEGWPFNRSYVLARDPDLENCAGIPLPWNS